MSAQALARPVVLLVSTLPIFPSRVGLDAELFLDVSVDRRPIHDLRDCRLRTVAGTLVLVRELAIMPVRFRAIRVHARLARSRRSYHAIAVVR